MARRKALQVPDQYWQGGKVPLGEEYYHYPSLRAQRFFHCLLSIGRSRAPQGHEHRHEHEDRFLLHYIHQGGFWYKVRGNLYRAPAHAVILMDLREPVRYGNDQLRTAHVWWVCFSGKDMPNLYVELGADQNPLFDKLDSRQVESLFLELLNLTRRKPAGFEPKSSAVLGSWLAELFASREGEPDMNIDLVNSSRREQPLSQPVRDCIRYIARFYESPLDLKRLSTAASLSLFHFSRTFHREVGMSPIQYLNRYRVEKAKRALISSDQPVQQIGAMVGIPNPHKFSRLFHKITGMTPTRFRARNK